ncbi:MarR family transcriptional regulator [Pseudomonas sp. FH4]|jgi:DNA-binding MarR family transcriptional regulator|uniref:DNA-binding transcriptional regulator, MarR family n=1 Tax=Pseudomonas brenneri TaxID=129817 RepID=A0A5B2UND7_9PSED|nr:MULTISPECIES: MarR family winged helix-turn-helix transcriptional regulator [Pseudomonas fluorescens group]MDZ4302853.1 MarR family winged helix-turn-helix transcriptional regulator [Pseudomonas sp.]ETK19152.1 MarR family transcriptional regulator [Pseudomonas sp. FH4]KAA2228523.1 winged helix-turn-helix transcriptional regulator [Pseudomonas brenneri]MBF8006547.1 winged helix-turn-helix transcriptional regulator [Pseudomonas brenneri]TWR76031.1 winged helix-turn-helix transcriptional regul
MSDTTLFDLLERLASLSRIWFRQHPLLAELQPIQLSALMYLARCNRYSNTPLGVTDYLGLTKGTVSQSLKALEAKGLIVKTQDAHDKRSVHLQLTDTARSLLDALLPPHFLAAGEARMGVRGLQLETLLGELLREVQRSADVPSFGLCSTCRFHQQVNNQPFCGLTQEPLAPSDAALICREHQTPEVPA